MKMFKGYLPRSLVCLIIALPIAVLASKIEPTFAPAVIGGTAFIGCWQIFTPSNNKKIG